MASLEREDWSPEGPQCPLEPLTLSGHCSSAEARDGPWKWLKHPRQTGLQPWNNRKEPWNDLVQ